MSKFNPSLRKPVEKQQSALECSSEIPDCYKLDQNFPNPANPNTTIRFHLPEAGKVKLTIYNIMGQKVRTLINSEKEPGVYTANWNGKDDLNQDVSSGIYLYLLVTERFKQSHKMIFLK